MWTEKQTVQNAQLLSVHRGVRCWHILQRATRELVGPIAEHDFQKPGSSVQFPAVKDAEGLATQGPAASSTARTCNAAKSRDGP